MVTERLTRQMIAAKLLLVMGDCNTSVGENIYNWKTCHAFLKADPESKKIIHQLYNITYESGLSLEELCNAD